MENRRGGRPRNDNEKGERRKKVLLSLKEDGCKVREKVEGKEPSPFLPGLAKRRKNMRRIGEGRRGRRTFPSEKKEKRTDSLFFISAQGDFA